MHAQFLGEDMTFVPSFRAIEKRLEKKYGKPKLIIAVSGLSGVGKTTIAKELAKKLRIPHISTGELFRKEARKRSMTLGSFLRNLKQIEKNEGLDIDCYFDLKMLEAGYRAKQAVVEGRLTGALFRRVALARLWVDCPSGFVAERVAKREKMTTKQAAREMRERNRNDVSRYEKKYGITFSSKSIYNVSIDNTQPFEESVNEALYKIGILMGPGKVRSIAISGKVGSGKSTVAREVAKRLAFRFVSAGSIFRKMADATHLSLTELLEQAKKRKKIHYELDKRMIRELKRGNCVAEGKLIVWLSEADLKVFLTATHKERTRRIAKREGMPFSEALKAVSHRDKKEEDSFTTAYKGLDYNKPKCHLFIDTTNIRMKRVVEMIIGYAK